MEQIKIDSLENIKANFPSLKDTNKIHKSFLNFQDKIALNVTKAIGTMYAVYFFMVFMAGWMIWQSFFSSKPFDPFPFAFLLFLGNIVQLLLMPLIMVGQNLQGKHAELRAQHDLETDRKAEKEIETILIHLENQQKLMVELMGEIESLKTRKASLDTP